jgi:8-oxo-dGTP diphosphatase
MLAVRQWRDHHGKSLTDYDRPSVAVDTAALTIDDQRLAVLTVRGQGGEPVLPGTFLHPGERLRDAARRALAEKAALRDVAIEQLAMFDDPNRDHRGWVLSMAHTAAVPRDRLPDDARLIPVVAGAVRERLGYDHDAMVTLAVTKLRGRYAETVDPAHFLGDTFTVLDLRRLYEAIFDRSFPKDTFRRHVLDGLLSTGETTTAGGGRPAELFRRSGVALPATAVAAFLHNPG